MSFSNKRNIIEATNYIRETVIEKKNEIRELNVILDQKLEYVKRETVCSLEFVKRECYKTFKFDNAQLLYSALVRLHLEYSEPYMVTFHSQKPERKQSKTSTNVYA